MPGVTSIGDIQTCVNQKDAFKVVFAPSTGVSLAGAVVTCQIRTTAQRAAPVLTPTIATQMAGSNLEATFSWTEEQSAVLVADGLSFQTTTTYLIEIDLALADAPTESLMRFVGKLLVAPGGNDAIPPAGD